MLSWIVFQIILFWFCILILYISVSLKYLAECFCCVFGVFTYKVTANSDNPNASFPMWMTSVSFFCPIALPRAPSTVWNKSVECGHSHCVPNLRENALHFLPSMRGSSQLPCLSHLVWMVSAGRVSVRWIRPHSSALSSAALRILCLHLLEFDFNLPLISVILSDELRPARVWACIPSMFWEVLLSVW